MISNKYQHIITCFLLLVSTTVSAQEEMTLAKAISIAIENNYAIKIAEKSIAVSETNNTWAATGKVPTITLNGDFNNVLINDNNPASFLQGTYYSGSLTGSANANMVVYSGGRFQVAKDQLDLLVSQEKLNKEVNIHELIRAIYQSYNTVLFHQEQLYVLEESYNLSRSNLDYEQIKKEYGQANSLNLIQFRTALLTDSITLVTQQLQVETSKANFYTLLMLSSDSNYSFSEVLSVTDEELEIEKLKAILSENNYTLKSLYVLQDLARLNTKLSKAQRRPTIGVNGGIGIAENAFNFFGDNPFTGMPAELQLSNRISGNLGANLVWDLYDGGVKNQAIQAAQLEEEIAQLNVEQASANLLSELAVLAQNYKTQKNILALTGDQIQLARENLDMVEERFKSGLISSLDFRTVQLQNLNAAFAKVNAIYNLILTKSEIDFLVGKFEG